MRAISCASASVGLLAIRLSYFKTARKNHCCAHLAAVGLAGAKKVWDTQAAMDSPSSAPPPPQSPEPRRCSAISAFAEREEILLGLYDLSPRGVLLTRPDGTIVGLNATACAM